MAKKVLSTGLLFSCILFFIRLFDELLSKHYAFSNSTFYNIEPNTLNMATSSVLPVMWVEWKLWDSFAFQDNPGGWCLPLVFIVPSTQFRRTISNHVIFPFNTLECTTSRHQPIQFIYHFSVKCFLTYNNLFFKFLRSVLSTFWM